MNTVREYFEALSPERTEVMRTLDAVILKNIPKGFKQEISFGMIGYVVPHDIYPGGYHCNPKLPLPFVSIASQKNFIVLYHMGMYANPALMNWFLAEYPKHVNTKLDMGKSCIRFKKPELIPFELIAELMQKISVQNWISTYEATFLKK